MLPLCLLFILAPCGLIGCLTQVRILDARATHEPSGEILVRFKTDRDILSLADWPAVHLYIPEQDESTGANKLREQGHCTIWNRIKREMAQNAVEPFKSSIGTSHNYSCLFPSKASPEDIRKISHIEFEAPYTLSNTRSYRMEFWVTGRSVTPGGFDSNRFEIELKPP